VGTLVEFEVRVAQSGIFTRITTNSTQYAMHACQYFGQDEWLGDVVVCTNGEPGHLVLQSVLSSQEDYWDPDTARTEPPDDLYAIQFGQHCVENYQIWGVILRQGKSPSSCGGLINGEAFVAQPGGQCVCDGWLIIRNQNPRTFGRHLPTSTRHTLASWFVHSLWTC
jgi:hypothetical protein